MSLSKHGTGNHPRSLKLFLRVLVAAAGVGILLLFVGLPLHRAASAPAVNPGPLATNLVRSAADFNWKQSPVSVLSNPGRNSVTLDPCPPGVLAAEPWYYVYISGNISEAVRVTGGSCKGDGHPGTLEFTTVHGHPAGYTVESASSGIQEASIAARFIPSNPAGVAQSGKVVIPPGEYDIFAPVSIRASGQTIDFEGSIVNCYTTEDACIFVGDHGSAAAYEDITLNSPRGRPMVANGNRPFIEDNAEQTRIFNLSTRRAPQNAGFGTLIQVDDDQAFLLDGYDSTLGGHAVTCNASFCGAHITAPGPFNRWSAVGWLKHMVLSLQCGGKGVEWISGNGLRISDSVIQGYSVYGVRVSNQRGGFGGFISENVYYEPSPSCKDYNPMGNVGSAGVIANGTKVKLSGLAANGASGVFPNWGSPSGSRDWLYWVVPVHARFGEGVPLPAGQALTNGSGKVTGTFPKIAGASSYKILKMDWDQHSTRPYPEGTGKYLLTTVQQSSCAAMTCTFTDSGDALSSFSNPAEDLNSNAYMPRLDFWPGAVIVSPPEDSTTGAFSDFTPRLQADVLGAGAIVSTYPSGAITGVANVLIGTVATPPAAANLDALQTNATAPIPGATIMKAANGLQTPESGHKGRLNFGHRGQLAGFTPLITLGDSNWGATWASADHRPTADVNDLDLGYEGTIDTFYSRAQKEIREYIGKFPDGNPQEKLSSSAKTINVPVTIHGDLTVTGKCTGCGGAPSGSGTSGSGGARWSVSLSGQKTAISSTNLCSSSPCAPGQYRVSYYLDSNAACPSPGNASTGLMIGWKDEASAKTMRVPLAGSGVSGNSLSLGQATSFGSGEISLWSAGNTAITYSTSYSGCSSGSGAYALRIALEKLQ
ncbi:MAG TPA: hypothetical protein VGG04_17550 [Candidatus Sulfotelmatobacter sp.]